MRLNNNNNKKGGLTYAPITLLVISLPIDVVPGVGVTTGEVVRMTEKKGGGGTHHCPRHCPTCRGRGRRRGCGHGCGRRQRCGGRCVVVVVLWWSWSWVWAWVVAGTWVVVVVVVVVWLDVVGGCRFGFVEVTRRVT